MANRFAKGFQKREEATAKQEAQKLAPVEESTKKETVPAPVTPKPRATTKKPTATKTVKPKEKEAVLFPSKKETKSKRLNLLFKPSDVAKWQKAAEKQGVTLTVFIETVVNSYCDTSK